MIRTAVSTLDFQDPRRQDRHPVTIINIHPTTTNKHLQAARDHSLVAFFLVCRGRIIINSKGLLKFWQILQVILFLAIILSF
jgi:hypothetical protein